MLGYCKLHSGTFKTKAGQGGLVQVPMYNLGPSIYVNLLYHVTGSSKELIIIIIYDHVSYYIQLVCRIREF